MNIEQLFIENTTLSALEINKFKIHIKEQNFLDWDDIMTGLKYVIKEAIKADRINLLEHIKVDFEEGYNMVAWLNKESLLNAPNIELL